MDQQSLHWIPIDEGVNAPVTGTKDGKRYALVKTNSDSSLLWSQIKGHVRHAMNKRDEISLEFDDELAEKLSLLTLNSLQRELAVIVNGQIIQAPKIMSTLSNALVISGKFSDEERQRLHEAFASAIPLDLDVTKRQVANSPLGIMQGGRILKAKQMGSDELANSSTYARRSIDIVTSQNNLRKLGLAFHNFHDVYRLFPGSVNHKEGATSHGEKEVQPFSWRVAILPFVEELALYEQYDFTQTWDSDHNLRLLEKMPDVFRSPRADEKQLSGHTNYLGYATGDSALGKDGGIKLRDFGDGAATTLLLVETKDSVPWTKPQDLDGDAKFFSPVLYVMADGSVGGRQAFDPDKLKKMINRNGGEERGLLLR